MRRRGITGIIIFVICVFFSAGAGAITDTWRYVGTGEKGSRLFYDSASVMYVSKDVIQVWTRELTAEGPAKKLKEMNCSFKIVRDLEVIDQGKQKAQLPPRPYQRSEWQAVEKNPLTKELFKALCK